MLIYTITMIILNIVMFISLRFTRQRLHLLEICAYWMFICAVVQQVFTIITMNLRFIVISEGVGTFWFLVMNRLIIYPSLIIWFFYFSKDRNLVYKILLTGTWLVALSSIQSLSNKFGFITFTKWNFIYSLVEWLIVISISLAFIHWFRLFLKKEELIV